MWSIIFGYLVLGVLTILALIVILLVTIWTHVIPIAVRYNTTDEEDYWLAEPLLGSLPYKIGKSELDKQPTKLGKVLLWIKMIGPEVLLWPYLIPRNMLIFAPIVAEIQERCEQFKQQKENGT